MIPWAESKREGIREDTEQRGAVEPCLPLTSKSFLNSAKSTSVTLKLPARCLVSIALESSQLALEAIPYVMGISMDLYIT